MVGGDVGIVHFIVKTEAEEVEFAAVFAVERNLPIKIQVVVWQPVVNVWVESFGGVLQVGALDGKNVAEGKCVFLLHFDEGAFQKQFGTESVDIHLAGDAFFVAVAGTDVHHGGNSAAEFRSEAAGVDVGGADEVAVEDGEETDGVERVVNQQPVKQQHVLDGSATAHVKLAALVAGGYDARQHLQVLREIGLPPDGWHLLDVFGSDGNYGGACLGDHAVAFCTNHHPLQHKVGFFQVEILRENGALVQFDGDNDGVVAHVGDFQRVVAGHQFGEHEGPVLFRQRSVVGAGKAYGNIRYRLPACCIIDKAANCGVLSKGNKC